MNAELIQVEQLLKQYDSVPDARQNPVRRGDFVVPYKIDKDCSNRIFICLQEKGLIKAEMLDVQRHDYLDKLKDAFCSDLRGVPG